MIWHNADIKQVLNELQVDDKIGLANGVVDERLLEYGQNVASNVQKPSFLKVFLTQLKSKTVIALIIIALVSFVVALLYREATFYSPLLIIAIVAINAVISAYYIYNSSNMFEKIKLITNNSK
jgi:magnesium-transporting ATPase (P-type)